jgi:hypothetical protein
LNRVCRLAALALAILVIGLGAGSCGGGKKPTQPLASGADSDGDGVPDASDNCPSVPGERQYDGCPASPSDVCSGNSPYAHVRKWGNLAPTYMYATSLPQAWRTYVDYAANTWNNTGSRLQVRKSASVVAADVANDNRNVICYSDDNDASVLGRTYTWYIVSSGIVTEADIRLNSTAPMTVGGDASNYDVWSVLAHEFGHFCGLGHVSDATQTMYPNLAPASTSARTLCDGDILGIRTLYP